MWRSMVRATVFLIFLLAGCNLFFEKPSFTIREIRLAPRSLTEWNLVLRLDVQNPNRYDIKVESLECTAFLNDKESGSGSLEKEIVLPKGAVSRLEVPVVLTMGGLGRSLDSVFSSTGVPYRISGKARMSAFLGSREAPFSREGTIKIKGIFRSP